MQIKYKNRIMYQAGPIPNKTALLEALLKPLMKNLPIIRKV